MPKQDPWDHARNIVVGTALGAAIVWARGSDASFGAAFLAAAGGATAAALGFHAIARLRRR